MPIHHENLSAAILGLTKKLKALSNQIKAGCDASKSHGAPATKQNLEKMEKRINMKIEDLTAAANALSTASDGVSVKLDTLIAKVEAVVASLEGATLTPEQEAAVTALKASATTAAAAGDKVDAEVAKLDKVLPTPAPAAQPSV